MCAAPRAARTAPAGYFVATAQPLTRPAARESRKRPSRMTRNASQSAIVVQKKAAASVVAYFDSRTWIGAKVRIVAAASAAGAPKTRAPARYIAGIDAVPNAAERRRATRCALAPPSAA